MVRHLFTFDGGLYLRWFGNSVLYSVIGSAAGLVCVAIGALVAVLPLIAAFVCLQRFWRSGLTAGAVKQR
jgi:ABC-type maltose transport system permease subunit